MPKVVQGVTFRITASPRFQHSSPDLPFKLNADRRHHIPKQRHKVMNSAAYDATLREHGNLTVWFTDEAFAAWKAQPHGFGAQLRW